MASIVQVKRLSGMATLPTKGSDSAAGFDLYAANNATVPPHGGRVLIPTDLAFAICKGAYGRIAPRSGLAVKYGITTGAGVVDADYRGNVSVLLFNHGDAAFEVRVGDRIAQIIFEVLLDTSGIQDVGEAELGSTERGAGGFGSTGK